MALSRFQRDFPDQVLAESGVDDLRACFNCATCTSACPISWKDSNYNPRQILRLISLGAKDAVLSSPTIWQCSGCDICYQRCPQHVHLSLLMEALRKVAIREGHEPPESPAQANKQACASCGLCVQACPYQAITLTPVWVDGRRQMVVPEVNQALCHQCGICTAICPVSAITIPSLGDQAIIAQVKEFAGGSEGTDQIETAWKPRITTFLCDWCLYSKLDQADVASVQAQSGVQVVRIPCLGRMDPWHILTALQEGIDGVLVIGCELGNCHYKHGNRLAENKITVLKAVLQAAGASARVQFAHVSSAERGVLLRLVEAMAREVAPLGPNRGGSLPNQSLGSAQQAQLLEHTSAAAPVGG